MFFSGLANALNLPPEEYDRKVKTQRNRRGLHTSGGTCGLIRVRHEVTGVSQSAPTDCQQCKWFPVWVACMGNQRVIEHQTKGGSSKVHSEKILPGKGEERYIWWPRQTHCGGKRYLPRKGS